MVAIKPDTSVYALDRAQPEFREQVWQYLNRRVSDWRIMVGRERAHEHANLLERIEREYGVDRFTMLGLWGMESAFGDVVVNPKHSASCSGACRPCPGRTSTAPHWEQELLNALVIIERGWAQPADMVGSGLAPWGHTQ
jgi:membrane-bound lytic murein transglycosylase B